MLVDIQQLKLATATLSQVCLVVEAFPFYQNLCMLYCIYCNPKHQISSNNKAGSLCRGEQVRGGVYCRVQVLPVRRQTGQTATSEPRTGYSGRATIQREARNREKQGQKILYTQVPSSLHQSLILLRMRPLQGRHNQNESFPVGVEGGGGAFRFLPPSINAEDETSCEKTFFSFRVSIIIY